MGFYSGYIKQLLNCVQIQLKEYIAMDNAFPNPKVFEMELERTFESEVKYFMKSGCECTGITT